MSKLSKLQNSHAFESTYKFGVGVKGIDGFIELVAGLWLLLFPGSLHTILNSLLGATHEYHGHISQFLAQYIARLNSDLVSSGTAFLIFFLISHGVIKLVMVYCLIKEILWAYPYALGLLVIFLIIQIVAFIGKPGIGMAALIFLDIAIIVLVWGEWRKLLAENHARS